MPKRLVSRAWSISIRFSDSSNYIARGPRHLCAAAHGNGDLRAGQYRRIVDAVTHHRHHCPALLQFMQRGELALGRHAGTPVVDAQGVGEMLHRGLRIAAEHGDLHTGRTQRSDQLHRLRPQRIGQRESGQRLSSIAPTR